MICLLSYLLAATSVFCVDRWAYSGKCQACHGICKHSSNVCSISVALLWPAIVVVALYAIVRRK